MTGRFTLPSIRRTAVAVLLAVVGALVLVGGPSGTTAEPAQAIGLDFCPGFLKNEDAPPPASYREGVEAITPTVDGVTNKTKAVTAYEQFGSSGLFWSRYDEDCSVFGPGKNMVANTFFSFATATTSITLGLYAVATDPDMMEPFMKPVNCLVKGCAGSKGLDDALYLNFLTPIIVLGALWAGWTGLVKKSTTQAWQGGLWMVGAAAFALFFMANPTGIANTANNLVASGNAITASAVTSATSSATPKSDICYLPEGAKNYGQRVSSCSIWKALSWAPWSTGQFGVPESQALPDKKVGEKCSFSGKAWKDMRVTQLCAQTITRDDVRSPNVDDIAASVFGGKENESKAQIWDGIKDQVGENSAWAGKDPGSRINIAFAAFIASMAAGLVIMIICFSNVVLALAMVLLIMAAPIFLLIGAHPGVGRGVALKWLELLLSTVVKRLILGFFLALLVGMYQIIITTDMSTIAKVILLMAVGVAAMIFRKPMMEALNVVNLGGTQTGIEQGGQGALQQAGNTATGATAGAIGAAFAGGGLGAILGASASSGMASRGGSMNPAIGATRQGFAQGSRRGEKSAQAREARRAQRTGSHEQFCLNCGESIPQNVSECPECGKDPNTAPSSGGKGGGNPRRPGGGGGSGSTPPPAPVPVPSGAPAAGAGAPSQIPTPVGGGVPAPGGAPSATPTPAPSGGLPTRPNQGPAAPSSYQPPTDGSLDLAREAAEQYRRGLADGERRGGNNPPPNPAGR